MVEKFLESRPRRWWRGVHRPIPPRGRRGRPHPPPGRWTPAAQPSRRGPVPPPGRQPARHAGAVAAGAGGRGGAAGGAAKRVGSVAARRVPRRPLEFGVRRRRGRCPSPEPGGDAVDAAEAVDRGVCPSVRAPHYLRQRSVPAEASAAGRGGAGKVGSGEFGTAFSNGDGGS